MFYDVCVFLAMDVLWRCFLLFVVGFMLVLVFGIVGVWGWYKTDLRVC